MTRLVEIVHGDCHDVMRREIADSSIDAIVTDPPYGLSFMGKRWDYDVPSENIWRECLRVLKPGGHLLAFAGTRTQHRMAVRIEDAGFEIRDMIAWVYGSGFPKSLDVSKALDKAAGHTRATEYEPNNKNGTFGRGMGGGKHGAQSEPPVTAAAVWQGWGTALKPALEPITVARKPLVGTVAANVLEYGTGAINVNGCRIETDGRPLRAPAGPVVSGAASGHLYGKRQSGSKALGERSNTQGRWPANLIHDGSEEVVSLFPHSEVSGCARSGTRSEAIPDGLFGLRPQGTLHNDSGSAARFFYCAKASKKDRVWGLEGFEASARPTMGSGIGEQPDQQKANNRNPHPTVKPTDLMRYLCRLVTPPGGVVLDPFTGSGSTGKAAVLEGFDFIGIEREAEYVEIARARVGAVL